MAQKVQYLLIDDLDGAEAAETVTFGLDGVNYEIDLSTDHAASLRESLAEWVDHARKVGKTPRGTRKPKAAGSSDVSQIREWAKANGYTVSARGRISAEIKAAYEAAH